MNRSDVKSSRIIVIANASAGTGAVREALNGVAEQFRTAGFDAEITFARTAAALVGAAERAPGEMPHAVVAAGGDGTLSTVAGRLVGTGIAFGVLPLGTLNHFARDLHIPGDIGEAARIIIAGKTALVDAGEVNGRYFLNNSSLGIYPEIVRDRERQQRRLGAGKWLAFLHATLAVLRRDPFLDVRLAVDGQDLRRRTPFVFVGNNEYSMEGLSMGERKCLDGGRLNIYLARHSGRLGLLRLALMALFGKLREASALEVFSAADLLVETSHRRTRIAVDGEVTKLDAPLHFRIHPGALRVLVP